MPLRAIDDAEAPGVEIAAMLMAVAGDRDDQHDLGDLRRLELERPDLEPGLRALVVAAEHDDARQQREYREIDERPQVADAPVVDQHHDDHRDEPDRRARAPCRST